MAGNTDYRMNKFTQMFWKYLFYFIFKIIYGVKVFGKDNIPANGAGILAPNHVSNFDPPLIAYVLNRPAYFMAKAELFKNIFLRKIVESLGAFPVKRGGKDKSALLKAVNILKNDDLLGMFPQGTRRPEGSFDRLHDGVATLALRMGVPIIPIAIIGSGNLKRNKAAVNIGEPIQVEQQSPTPELVAELNARLSNSLEKLYNEKKYINVGE